MHFIEFANKQGASTPGRIKRIDKILLSTTKRSALRAAGVGQLVEDNKALCVGECSDQVAVLPGDDKNWFVIMVAAYGSVEQAMMWASCNTMFMGNKSVVKNPLDCDLVSAGKTGTQAIFTSW
eukprot:TRINITY_DN3076_c0_g1_i10.p3 TRINITY_DN3076_c0_g1~~TRINITY_DN3076_c0_g1_i10.p3  ORF type:complete len:123 (+),score=29.07 TRINITY_DN3076_c0_g1_i10:371-739(+)